MSFNSWYKKAQEKVGGRKVFSVSVDHVISRGRQSRRKFKAKGAVLIGKNAIT